MDEFIDIIGYEGLYKINKNGDVYGVKNKKIVNTFLNNKGYYIAKLRKNKIQKHYLLHRLVAINFIPNDDKTKNIVDHIDGIPTNNNIENLRWVTNIDNCRNRISKNNYITEYTNKENGKIYYLAAYSIYINGKRIIKQKNSKYRNIVDEFIEEMKKNYPNSYTAGRI